MFLYCFGSFLFDITYEYGITIRNHFIEFFFEFLKLRSTSVNDYILFPSLALSIFYTKLLNWNSVSSSSYRLEQKWKLNVVFSPRKQRWWRKWTNHSPQQQMVSVKWVFFLIIGVGEWNACRLIRTLDSYKSSS